MAFSNRTEEYYKKFIELQDKLRKSEEERLKLEIKFNEMLQMAREEKQTHYLNLRSQYKRFLEEDGRRQDRNERILRTMERIENRISMLVAKTERFKLLRRQYQAFLDRIYKAKETKKFEASSLAGMELSTEKLKDDLVNKQQYLQNLSPKELSVEKPKDDLVEQYLRNLSSQKLKDLLVNENERRERKPFHLTSHERRTESSMDTRSPFDSGDFQPNYANSIADDIMNSIYSKNKFDFTPLTREEDSEQRPPTQSVNFNWESVKDNQEDVIEKDRFRGEENVHKAAFIDKYERESESSDSAASSIRERVHFQAPVKQTIPFVHDEYNSIDKEGKETEVQVPQEEKEEDSVVKTEESVSVVSPKSEVKQKEVNLNINETLPTAENENETLSTAENENETLSTAKNENETLSTAENENKILPTAENEKFENLNQNSDLGLKTDSDKNETVTQSNKEEEFQEEEEIGAPAITEISEPVTGALENKEQYGGEALYQQYEENAQYSQQYYNENGQPLYNEYNQIQYDENGQPIQQYDQFGQYSEQYDENGQLIQPYDINSQYDQSQFIQYDENGKPLLQYDENGQLIQQFEQYDENGQPIQQYYDNEQPIQQQYDEKGQVIENIFQQYDQLEQPILESVQEYNENAQPAKQDDHDEHLRYGENGELLPKYEDGEQIHTEKGDAPKTPENPDEEANSKNSEIPENEEHSKDESNEKESGRNKKLETRDPQTKHETRNVMEMLDTDSESVRQDTEISNDNDFDFSNG